MEIQIKTQKTFLITTSGGKEGGSGLGCTGIYLIEQQKESQTIIGSAEKWIVVALLPLKRYTMDNKSTAAT